MPQQLTQRRLEPSVGWGRKDNVPLKNLHTTKRIFKQKKTQNASWGSECNENSQNMLQELADSAREENCKRNRLCLFFPLLVLSFKHKNLWTLCEHICVRRPLPVQRLPLSYRGEEMAGCDGRGLHAGCDCEWRGKTDSTEVKFNE